MNASQRRIARRQTLAVYPVGSSVYMPSGKPGKVEGTNHTGRRIMVRRGDNRVIPFRWNEIEPTHVHD